MLNELNKLAESSVLTQTYLTVTGYVNIYRCCQCLDYCPQGIRFTYKLILKQMSRYFRKRIYAKVCYERGADVYDCYQRGPVSNNLLC